MADRPDRSMPLLPGPRSVRLREDLVEASQLCFATERPAAALIRPALDYLTDRCSVLPNVDSAAEGPTCEIGFVLAEELPAEGYRLSIAREGIQISASSRSGLFYGAITLRQWLTSSQGPIQGVEIRDRPDFRRRGFLLDISRNKVPTMVSLLRLVDLLAELKINELQLYMEHTFAYPGHEEVWRDSSPLTAHEIQELDGYCRLRCIDLVPNQNSFGHMHRWLSHPRYRPLAECPEGVKHAFSDEIEPFSLCPTDPKSLELLRDLYGKLLPNFTSGRFHVGFDETFEIGRGRSRKACAELGLGQIFLNHLESVRKAAAEYNRRIEIWADMLLEHRKLVPKIPEDVVLCAWGYEAAHPFREDCARLSATNCEVHVCPGTSSWSSFSGRAQNALVNLEEAASGGMAAGARGFLITDWGDRGHLQPFASSYLGLAAGAAFAWHRADAKRRDLADWGRAIDHWVLDSPECALGEAALELANTYLLTGATQKNGTALFHLLMSPGDGLEHPRYRGLDKAGLATARDVIESVIAKVSRSPAKSPEARRTRDELLWVADTLHLSCSTGDARLDSPLSDLPNLPAGVRAAIRNELAELTERRRELWLERNRPGGLDDSIQQFTQLDRML